MILDATGKEIQAVKRGPNLDPDFFKRSSSGYGLAQVDTSTAIRKPFGYNAWVYACCSAISQNLIQLPHVLRRKGAKDPITDHDILTLFQNPNPMMTGSDLWEAIILNLLLSTSRTPGGQCFLIGESGISGKRVNFRKGEIPLELYPFSDELVFPRKDSKGILVGWDLKVGASKIEYSLNEVIRIHLFNPYDPLLGMAPISAALAAVAKDAEANGVNLNFFKNGATLGGVLTTDQEIDDRKLSTIKSEWNSVYSGSQASGRTAVLHSGLKYDQFARTHLDMQFIDQLRWSRDEYCAVYRVPKSELSIYEDVRDDSAKASDFAFWTKVVIPYDKRIWHSINSSWIRYVERGNLEGSSDYAQVEALQAFIGDKIDNAAKLVAMNVPFEEASKVVKLEVDTDKYPWLKRAYVNMSLVPIDQLDELQDNEEETQPESDDLEKQFTKASNLITINKDIRDKFINAYVLSVLDPQERLFRKTMERYFFAQRNKIQDLIDGWVSKFSKSKGIVININDFLPDVEREGMVLSALADPLYASQIEAEASAVKDELGGKFFLWNKENPNIQGFKAQRIQELKRVNTTTFRALGDKIGNIISEVGKVNPTATPQELAKAIKAGVSDVYNMRNSQAKTIARTETGIMSSTTRFNIMDVEGVRYHEWGTFIDGNTRDTHKSEDGHVCRIGERFPVTGLNHPNDPKGPPEEIINCRCVALMRKSL